MPFTSDKIRLLLNQKPILEKGELNKMLDNLSEGNNILKNKHQIGDPVHLFTRIDDEIINIQVDKLKSKSVANLSSETAKEEIVSTPEIKSEITYDDFVKMDIRTATIIGAEKIEKADKLLKLTLDLGFETRTVVSGIAEYYAPENIIGTKVSLLANLAPRKMRGVESQGMILMAENLEGKLSFVSPTEEQVNNGAIIK